MADQSTSPGSGILRGLKKVLFTQDEAPAAATSQELDQPPAPVQHADSGSTADMKLKVYQLLESLNKPGMDFFEVWNAAVEMGGANSANLRAAFTSLRFADKQLTKEHLLQSGREYIMALQQVIEKESARRVEEKNLLETQRESTRRRLDEDIQRIEAELEALEEKRESLRRERDGIDERFVPRIREIDQKIDAGQRAVDEVIGDMQAVIGLLQQDIN
jgi:hypothetical protein